MSHDVILNKVSIIERCISRVHEEYQNDPNRLKNITVQDSIILNIQRACEASIDLAMVIVANRKLGLPQSSREAFELLEAHRLIDERTAERMKAMVGFRNIAVHDYQQLNLDIVQQIIEKHLEDFKTYTQQIIKGV
jgi:uncharacterized protein YutE (UPF0331/DUF86 family)